VVWSEVIGLTVSVYCRASVSFDEPPSKPLLENLSQANRARLVRDAGGR